MARRRAELEGRVVVVTGADVPPGPETARALAAEGAAVVLCGTDTAALGALAADLQAGGARAAVFTGDPADAVGRAALAEMVAELFPAA